MKIGKTLERKKKRKERKSIKWLLKTGSNKHSKSKNISAVTLWSTSRMQKL